ncbi:nitrous oxide reductase accessory protein NosL [Aliikangiella sp. G2MR2-5]|uniref:nitrous oxide reductase accessory protein NosL n=1 Tax=Aliikangiella sp. G2MR2-5 TaxID=2788943 RepID=UPI0018AA3672|nr:nitrous oxide reductase accessory protein NosL [Aliikangiella sp. G2MR2-5]
MSNLAKLALVGIFSFLLSACGQSDKTPAKLDPVAFEKSDECHVCGMVISRFEGPKGQAFDKRSKQAKKFCSTKELIFWYLQPENQHNVIEMYVHDMAKTPWNSPDDEHLISARDAFYVLGSDLKGSMGGTLATFISVNDAAKFSKEHGGEVVTFNGLTLEVLAKH